MNVEEFAFAYNINSTGMSGIITMTNPPKLVCYCDEENSKTILNALNPPLPPAEGAVQLNKQIKQLKEFHTAFNLPQRQVPTIMPSPEFFLRHKILMEEAEELREAYNEGDIVEVADAITDCLYVLIGTALQFGIADKLEACFDEVHRSNMSKLGNDGKPIMREDGKVMKGENFKRPDLKRVLNEPVAAQQQPTAEGAEEILASLIESLGEPDNSIHDHSYEIRPLTVNGKCEWWMFHNGVGSGEPLAQWLQNFATLHAQRIADKKYADTEADGFVFCGKCGQMKGGQQ